MSDELLQKASVKRHQIAHHEITYKQQQKQRLIQVVTDQWLKHLSSSPPDR